MYVVYLLTGVFLLFVLIVSMLIHLDPVYFLDLISKEISCKPLTLLDSWRKSSTKGEEKKREWFFNYYLSLK